MSSLEKILRYTSWPVEGGVVFVFNPKVANTYNEAAGQDKFGKWGMQGRPLVLYVRVIVLSSYVPALEEGYLFCQRWRWLILLLAVIVTGFTRDLIAP